MDVLLEMMSVLEKLKILGESAKYDICSFSANKNKYSCDNSANIPACCHSVLPDGRWVTLFKVLMTNNCINDCKYCSNRAGRKAERTSFSSKETAKLFLDFYRRNYVEGIFLSSGVHRDTDITMENMIECVNILRTKYQFKGYVHLKVLPGASYEHVKQASELADRVSINLEAPNSDRLSGLCSQKDFKNDLMKRMNWAASFAKKGKIRSNTSADQTTQFVIGAGDESDCEILRTVDALYRELKLKRSYFSAFQPIGNTPLQHHIKTPLLREHRLYQCDYLIRKYRFSFDELSFDNNENLPLKLDPKMVIALQDEERSPVDINLANFNELIRVPGIGPISARRIIKLRGKYKFEKIRELRNIGVAVKRAKYFIELCRKRQTSLNEFKMRKI